MTLGGQRSAGTKAILRPLSPLNLKARIKSRTGLAAQVEDPESPAQGTRSFHHPTSSDQAQVDLEEQEIQQTSSSNSLCGRSRSNTTSSVLTTTSSSSSIPTITLTEAGDEIPRDHYRSRRRFPAYLTETEDFPREAHSDTEFAEEAEGESISGTGLGSGSTADGLRASASSVSLSGALPSVAPSTTHQQRPGTTSAPVLSASSARVAGRVPPGVDVHRDPRLITVSSHVPCGESNQPLPLHLLSHSRPAHPPAVHPSHPVPPSPSNCTFHCIMSLSFALAIITSKNLNA